MKNKKKIIFLIIIFLLLSIIGLITYLGLTKDDKTTNLNFLDKQWIDNNKNKRFDFSIVTEVPLFSYDGEGIFLDFVSDFEKVTGLEFNKISEVYGKDNENIKYGFKIVDELADNDILLYDDNYVLLTNSNVRYENIKDLNNILVGVLSDEVTIIDYYLKGANIAYKPFDTVSELFKAIENDKENNVVASVDAIIIPKTLFLSNVLKNDKLNISYNITELSKKYVLSLGDNNKLNEILSKYYNKWKNENFNDKYNKYLSNLYFNILGIEEKQKSDFRGKQYVYGFINNGINYSLVNNFSKFAGIEILYQKYNSYNDLISAFNQNNVDFMFNNITNTDYKIDVKTTISNYDERLIVLGNNDNNTVINSVNSLYKKNIKVIADSMIEYYLKSQNFEVESYKNIEQIVNKFDKDDLLVIDYYTYKYYYNDYFNDFDLKYDFYLSNDYNFIFRDISDNKLFYQLFNFYLSFLNDKKDINMYYYDLYKLPVDETNYKSIIIISIIVVLILLTIICLLILNNLKNKNSVVKNDKLKYIDLLTSLKNRNYLNDNIEKWDSSEIYPQAIIIADLNKVSYINDNYGHNEGDKLIKEAANILIKNQIDNTEIMRTNGNEFLIYLVGYDEKQVITYIKKLNKEFKELAHGFGIAIGYSMINDAIKTIDDAVIEATTEMKNVKEEANN